ncbi:hypothetical protein [Xanthomonas sp. MUS 060]|uniref:hypothetical protein n=1 Tax=Xanthomonas sp. MUS 060 TaxID=1588031 RepID=UPI0013793343|nr:hypothetical protein [Xanthomonas sp. MUS 060]
MGLLRGGSEAQGQGEPGQTPSRTWRRASRTNAPVGLETTRLDTLKPRLSGVQ